MMDHGGEHQISGKEMAGASKNIIGKVLQVRLHIIPVAPVTGESIEETEPAEEQTAPKKLKTHFIVSPYGWEEGLVTRTRPSYGR